MLSASQLLQLPDLAQDCTDLLKNDISIDSVVHLAHFFLESSPNDPLVQDVKDGTFCLNLISLTNSCIHLFMQRVF